MTDFSSEEKLNLNDIDLFIEQISSVIRGKVVTQEQVMELVGDYGISCVWEDLSPALKEAGYTILDSEDIDVDDEEKVSDRRSISDPVKIYLREMGFYELLTREGEIAIAKRIIAGKQKILHGLSLSSITLEYLEKWYQEIKDGTMQLRKIFNLEASRVYYNLVSNKSEIIPTEDGTEEFGDTSILEDEEQNISISFIEEQLIPYILKDLENIMAVYSKFKVVQKERIDALINKEKNPILEEDYNKYQNKLSTLVMELQFNSNAVSDLVEIHRAKYQEIIAIESQILQSSKNYKIEYSDFFEKYMGYEGDLNWDMYLSNKVKDPHWNNFACAEKLFIQHCQKSLLLIMKSISMLILEFKYIYSEIQYGDHMSSRAKKEMVESNLRLIVSIAKKYLNRGVQFLDLIQEGNIGLMKAVEKFNYLYGNKIATYSCWWGHQNIHRSVSACSRMIRLPVHAYEQYSKLNNITRKMFQELGHEPQIEDIAEKMGITVDKVRKIMRIAKEPLSLETPLGDNEDSSIGDFIESKDIINPLDYSMQNNLKINVMRALLALPARDDRILRMRYGIGIKSDHTLESVGKHFRVTRERIRQIEDKAIRRLCHPNRSKNLMSFLDN